MREFLFIALGGAVGASLRYFVSGMFAKSYIGTLAVNLVGCFLIGVCFAITEWSDWPSQIKLVIFTGFLGAFTTFSTFSLDTLQLLIDAKIKVALLYFLASNLLGISLAAIGLFSTRYLLRFF